MWGSKANVFFLTLYARLRLKLDQPDQMEQVDLNGRNNVNADQLQLFQIKS